jgi:oxygen-independent coproporphyrinogen-3 oxidase
MTDVSPHSLYLHIPFCVSKCPYCDFNSHVGMKGLFESYSRALVSEIQRWGEELGAPRLDTVFIGGGTPSRVPAAHIRAALDAVRESFALAPEAEITLEANPQSAESEKMEAWLEAGVNRLSLGFQSLDGDALAFLERAHTAGEAVEVFGRARTAGFGNVSCDLIFAIPGLTTSRWEEVLAEVLQLGPDHVSAYELTPEGGTRLGADVASGRTLMPDDDVKLEQYAVAERLLVAAGMARYEVSNWARPARECRHNMAYWSGVPYAAAGAGAHAFLFAESAPQWLRQTHSEGAVTARQWNLANPAAYITAVRDQGHALAGHEWLDLATNLGDLMMMGLRMPAGVDLAAASGRFGIDVSRALAATIDGLAGAGLLRRDGDIVAATEGGMLVLNRVVAAFVGHGTGASNAVDAFDPGLESLALRYSEC